MTEREDMIKGEIIQEGEEENLGPTELMKEEGEDLCQDPDLETMITGASHNCQFHPFPDLTCPPLPLPLLPDMMGAGPAKQAVAAAA